MAKFYFLGEIRVERIIFETILKTDAGGLVENTKVIERILLKELGKISL